MFLPTRYNSRTSQLYPTHSMNTDTKFTHFHVHFHFPHDTWPSYRSCIRLTPITNSFEEQSLFPSCQAHRPRTQTTPNPNLDREFYPIQISQHTHPHKTKTIRFVISKIIKLKLTLLAFVLVICFPSVSSSHGSRSILPVPLPSNSDCWPKYLVDME